MTTFALIYVAIGTAFGAWAMIEVERSGCDHRPADVVGSTIAASIVAILWLPIVITAALKQGKRP